MKALRLTLIVLVSLVSSCTLTNTGTGRTDSADADVLAKVRQKGSYESNLVGDLLKPFEPDSLVRLAEHPESGEAGQLVRLILRAGVEKDVRFQYLLAKKELRKNAEVDLALLAFDYSVNGNQSALKTILSRHVDRASPRSWESSTVLVLGYVDEWNLTKKAFESRPMSADGAGGDAQYAFWLRRRLLFPSNHQIPDNFQEFSNSVRDGQER